MQHIKNVLKISLFLFVIGSALAAINIGTVQALGLGFDNFYSTDYLSPYLSDSTSAIPEVAADSSNKLITAAAPSVVSISAYAEIPTYTVELTRRDGHLYATETQTGTEMAKASTGSGFFVSSNGYILTNKHVVSETGVQYKVDTGTAEVPALVVYRDANADIALVKIEGGHYPTLRLGDSSRMQVGDAVMGIGNALGLLVDSISSGKVSAFNQDIVVEDDYGVPLEMDGLIQINAQLYPGDSGGPLLNKDGQVVGINTATEIGGGRSVGFSLPINTAKEAMVRSGINL